MPNEIVKVPDTDPPIYCVWSSVTEDPHAWGTKEQITEWLVELDRLKEQYARPEVEARMQRAEENGTSLRSGQLTEMWIFRQQGILHLRDLKAFLDSFDGNNGFDTTLLEPFDD